MIRPLGRADTAETLALLQPRPLQNVYLEYLVRLGALGALPGFHGSFAGGRLVGVILVAGTGGTVLEARDPEAIRELAAAARDSAVPPRHIVGPEEVTTPFWEAYAEPGVEPLWQRREPVYVVERGGAREPVARGVGLAQATDADTAEVVENSARQYVEDLKIDRRAQDPAGFHARHAAEVRDGRWWVLRDHGRVAFQVHVGPENAQVVQLGGVFTVPEARGRGVATRGVAALVLRLLERRPAVSLFCDAANAPARRVYEKVGFRERFFYRSWLLG
jgi:predicted GNAT family acetyltransferase